MGETVEPGARVSPAAQPLLDAVFHADLDRTRELLAAQPHLANAAVYRQNTLLFFAARVPGYTGHGDAPRPEDACEAIRVELIDLLVARGADVNVRNQRKVTPLHMAARYALPLVAVSLLRHGAEVDARDVNQETPLFRAVNLGHREVARILLQHGAAPDLPDRRGQKPLHRAVIKGNLPLIRLLLEHGAELQEADQPYVSRLQVALSRGDRVSGTGSSHEA
jgi:ankyrin repeat protein